MVREVLGVAACVAMALGATTAAAQSGKVRKVTLDDLVIVGRVQRPIAAIDVARVPPTLTLNEIRQSFVERIERAASRVPY